MNDKYDNYVSAHSKSCLAGFLLTLFFGPLGLFYCNVVAAGVLTILAVASFTTVFGPIIIWLISIPLGFLLATKHNNKVKADANMYKGDD